MQSNEKLILGFITWKKAHNVIPANAGIQSLHITNESLHNNWIPAFAGMTYYFIIRIQN